MAESPYRLFKRDTVSEKFNKAENSPGCKLAFQKLNIRNASCPEMEEKAAFPKPKKKGQFSREEKFCFYTGMGSGS